MSNNNDHFSPPQKAAQQLLENADITGVSSLDTIEPQIEAHYHHPVESQLLAAHRSSVKPSTADDSAKFPSAKSAHPRLTMRALNRMDLKSNLLMQRLGKTAQQDLI
jgi:hypothetical protein